MPSVLWRCWLGGRTEWCGAGMVICLEQGADLHMAQLMPLPLTVSCFSTIQIDFTFLVPAHTGNPGQRAAKRVCVCCSCNSGQMLLSAWFHFRISVHAVGMSLIETISKHAYFVTNNATYALSPYRFWHGDCKVVVIVCNNASFVRFNVGRKYILSAEPLVLCP